MYGSDSGWFLHRVRRDRHGHHQDMIPFSVEPPQASVVSSYIQVPNVQALGELGPRRRVRLRFHLDEHDVDLPLGVRQERVLAGVLGVVQHLRFLQQILDFHLIRILFQAVDVLQLHIWNSVELVFLEINFVEISVHVEANDAEVV